MENQEKLDDVNVFADDSLDQEPNNEDEQQEQFDDSENDFYDPEEFVDKRYERVLLDGQTVTVNRVLLHMPKKRDEWKLTLKKNHYKIDCGVEIGFDTENEDREFYSGFMVLKELKDKDDVTKPIPARYDEKGELRKPTCNPEGNSQMADLLRVFKRYLLKKGIDAKLLDKEYGWNALFKYLKTKPKVIIETRDVKNPITGKDVKKNFIKDFVLEE